MKTPREVIAEHLFDTDRWNLLVEAEAFGDGILEALDAAGYQIVPKEPTTEMLKATDSIMGGGFQNSHSDRETWDAMLSAAPK